MKLTIQHFNVRSTDAMDSLVESTLCSLESRLRIDEAVVLLEERLEASPRFRVRVHLVTPGPDVMVETSDHSLAAAIRKADTALRSELDRRDRKRADRLRAPAQRAGRGRAGVISG